LAGSVLCLFAGRESFGDAGLLLFAVHEIVQLLIIRNQEGASEINDSIQLGTSFQQVDPFLLSAIDDFRELCVV
jgi:hypothetical protein